MSVRRTPCTVAGIRNAPNNLTLITGVDKLAQNCRGLAAVRRAAADGTELKPGAESSHLFSAKRF